MHDRIRQCLHRHNIGPTVLRHRVSLRGNVERPPRIGESEHRLCVPSWRNSRINLRIRFCILCGKETESHDLDCGLYSRGRTHARSQWRTRPGSHLRMFSMEAKGKVEKLADPFPHRLQAGRVLAGLGVGGCSMVVPIYISELAPPAVRGRLVGSKSEKSEGVFKRSNI